MKKAIIWMLLTMFSCLASSQNIENFSCDTLIDQNTKNLQLLKIGMTKKEVLSVMGIAKCETAEGSIENAAKSYSFKSGADAVEVLSFIVGRAGQSHPVFKQITLKHGNYENGRVGFITSPSAGS